MASAQTTDSDIEDTSQFNPDDWIGLGKGRNVPAPNDFPTVPRFPQTSVLKQNMLHFTSWSCRCTSEVNADIFQLISDISDGLIPGPDKNCLSAGA